jgi:hypothetical protein
MRIREVGEVRWRIKEGRGEIKNENEKENVKGKRKKKIKKGREGYFGHFTLSHIFHSQEKLFCQTFLQNGFHFTS